MFDRLTGSKSQPLPQDIDQTIDEKYAANLTDLDKIPDIVKCIRDFSGQPGEFSSWKKSVDRVLHIYDHLKGTPKYYGILSIIRNKIIGHADTVLESYNTPLNWLKISRCLTLHYADKRDLGTLEYQMTTLVQGNQTVSEFYQMVYQHLSLILNKLSCMEMEQESLSNITQSYRDKALDTFIRGLKGDLPRLLSIREPSDLPQALHLCLKLQNVDFRTQYANSNNHNISRRQGIHIPPPIPRRNSQSPYPQQQFYPHLLHNPQNYQNVRYTQPNNQQQYNRMQFNYTTYPPKPMPRPEPMEVDSFRSRQINYMNRPQNPQNNQWIKKRPFVGQPNQSQQIHRPNKIQRVYHNEQFYDEPNLQRYEEQILEHDTQFDETLVEYTNTQDTSALINEEDLDEHREEDGEIQELDDINFLA